MVKLSWMRKHATSWIIKFLLGSIVVVFIFWGGSSTLKGKHEGLVAEVNGEPISGEAYNDAYNRLLDRYRQQFGGRIDDELIKRFNIKQIALDQLVDEKLMLQEAARFDFRVSEDELMDSIAKVPTFQKNGVFDQDTYNRVLSYARLTPERFEMLQKNLLLTNKIRTLVQDGVKVSEPEALEWYKWNHASIRIDYVLFDPAQYKEISATAEDIQAHYDRHKESYKTEPKVKARFLHFTPDTYQSGITIPEDEIKEYYETHTSEFKTPKTVEARHILMKTDPNSKPEEIEKKREKALEIMKLAKGGKDFGELAKTYSEDPGTKDNGGYLGAFEKEMMVAPFSEKAFSMQPGEISDPVKTQFGWHIIKVEKVREETITSESEAKPAIIQKLTVEKAKSNAYNEAEKLYDALTGSDDLSKVAADRKLNLVTTGLFTRKGPETGVKNRAKFAAAAFALELNQISEVQDLDDGYYIIQVIEKLPEAISELKDVEEKVKTDVIRQKQEEKAKTEAEEFLTALKSGKAVADEAKSRKLTAASTTFFKRHDSIPDIGFEQEISDMAFKLNAEKPLPEHPVKGKKGYYVIHFKERKEPAIEEFENEKKSVMDQLLNQKRVEAFDAWLSQVKKKSQITYHKGFTDFASNS